MLYNIFFFFLFSFIIFSDKVYSQAYCCCQVDSFGNFIQCISSDQAYCCNHSDHPVISPGCSFFSDCGFQCQGIKCSGDLSSDPNPCGNARPPCASVIRKHTQEQLEKKKISKQK